MKLSTCLLALNAFCFITCSKKSEKLNVTFKANLASTTGSSLSGSANAVWDGQQLTINVNHNMGTAGIPSDGMYNKETGIIILPFANKVSPFSFVTEFSSGVGSLSDMSRNIYEIRFHQGPTVVLARTFIKQ